MFQVPAIDRSRDFNKELSASYPTSHWNLWPHAKTKQCAVRQRGKLSKQPHTYE